jgi:hypothetical protein
MKVKLLIATSDVDYAEHLSNILAEKYADTFEINVCSSSDRLRDMLSAGKFETAPFDFEFLPLISQHSIPLPMVLIDESWTAETENNFKKVLKCKIKM